MDNNPSILFTIFTPTYNRADLLPRVYECLLNQSEKCFKWLIISDGSTDGTTELVRKWIEEDKIKIEYHWQENHGKISCLKKAFSFCDTDYLIDLDDDDILYPEAVKTFREEWDKIGNQDSQIGSIRALTLYPNGDVVGGDGNDIGRPSIDTSYLDMQVSGKLTLENETCWLKSAIQNTEFFDYEPYWMGQKVHFVGECVFWSRFARKYKSRYLFVPVRQYYITENSILRGKRDPRVKWHSQAYTNLLMLNENYDYLKKSPKQLFRRLLLYLTYTYSLSICPFITSVSQLSCRTIRLYSYLLFPVVFGLKVYLRRWKYKMYFSKD